MDISPQDQTTQPISDDQELAKALAGVMPDEPAPEPAAIAVPPLQFEETPAPVPAEPVAEEPQIPAVPEIVVPEVAAPATNDLETIKKDALSELRPIIDKVSLPPEEKFNTYLMLIRSTDDATLIGPAHTAAQAITDEKQRAEALLDIIKEIDYLSQGGQSDTQPTA